MKVLLQELNDLFRNSKEFYLNKIRNRNKVFDFRSHHMVILFGAADLGKNFIDLCRENKLEVLACCDNNKSLAGKLLNGVKIIFLDDLLQYPKDIPIIITIMHDHIVKRQLASLGFTNVWSHTYFSIFYPDRFKNHFWYNSIETILQSKKPIFSLFNLFKDSLSPKTFLGVIKYRLFLNESYLKKIVKPICEIYFDKDIIHFADKEIFVDGGAYIGDTISKFIKATAHTFKKIYAFEPDIFSYQRLKERTKDLDNDKITTYSFGLGKEPKELRFITNGSVGGRISDKGNTLIKIVPLDKILKKEKPTLVKLDIEGAEQDALLGMKKIIAEPCPKLAICVYHKPADLWEIPLLIHKLNPNYQIFLRHYSETLHESVCYAI